MKKCVSLTCGPAASLRGYECSLQYNVRDSSVTSAGSVYRHPTGLQAIDSLLTSAFTVQVSYLRHYQLSIDRIKV